MFNTKRLIPINFDGPYCASFPNSVPVLLFVCARNIRNFTTLFKTLQGKVWNANVATQSLYFLAKSKRTQFFAFWLGSPASFRVLRLHNFHIVSKLRNKLAYIFHIYHKSEIVVSSMEGLARRGSLGLLFRTNANDRSTFSY